MTQRPEGCACPLKHENGRPVAKRDRCDDEWIRCNERLKVVQAKRLKDAKALLKSAKVKP